MVEEFLGFLVFLFILAVITREDFVFTVLYLFAGAFILGGFWSRKSISAVSFKRAFPNRAFLNEEITVDLEIANTSWMPVIWLRIHDSLPTELAIHRYFRQVLSLGPHAKSQYHYQLVARKRGYYQIGPLFAATGDVLGLLGEQRSEGKPDFITVYPRIIPFTRLKLPSNSPMGTLRHTQPIFEDPSRVLSKRDYQVGDSLRRVDWKASASIGRLQVKQFEPSIALETAIFLNLNTNEYELRSRVDATELAIVVAASIANWVTSKKQSVGFITNGLDPFEDGIEKRKKDEPARYQPFQPIPPRKGRSHLMRILDVLARIEAGETIPMVGLLQKESIHLPWGTTNIIITSQADGSLFDELFQERRAGANIVLVLVGPRAHSREVQQRAEYFKFPIYQFTSERDLDIWRR